MIDNDIYDKTNTLDFPIESVGLCKGKKSADKRCNYKGTLANGRCVTCWDKIQSTAAIRMVE